MQGETYEEALSNIKDTIALHLQDRLAQGETIDVPEMIRGSNKNGLSGTTQAWQKNWLAIRFGPPSSHSCRPTVPSPASEDGLPFLTVKHSQASSSSSKQHLPGKTCPLRWDAGAA